MTALEIRLLAYAALLGLFAWGIHTLDAHHYERLEALEQVARDNAIQAQQQKAIADLQAQQAATVAAENRYVALKASSDDLSTRLARSVQEYGALRGSLVSATATAAALADAASQGARSNSEIAGLVREATGACLDDSAKLSALQAWASGLGQ